MAQPSKSPTDLAVKRYVRHLFEQARKSPNSKGKQKSLRDVADEFGVSHPTVKQHLDPKFPGNVGKDLENLLAERFHGGLIDAFRKAALEFALANPLHSETGVVYDPRYPNRAAAIEMAMRGLGVTAEEGERLAPKALQSGDDPPIFWWLDQIRSAFERKRKGLAVGRELTDADDED
jgi:hypothetical protein